MEEDINSGSLIETLQNNSTLRMMVDGLVPQL